MKKILHNKQTYFIASKQTIFRNCIIIYFEFIKITFKDDNLMSFHLLSLDRSEYRFFFISHVLHKIKPYAQILKVHIYSFHLQRKQSNIIHFITKKKHNSNGSFIISFIHNLLMKNSFIWALISFLLVFS
jgi:hypothetical protein